jgi:hypothetical protein
MLIRSALGGRLRAGGGESLGPAVNPGLLIKVFGSLAAVLWLGSAVFWALSASIEIRDNMDAFIGDLQRAGHWLWQAVLLPSAKCFGVNGEPAADRRRWTRDRQGMAAVITKPRLLDRPPGSMPFKSPGLEPELCPRSGWRQAAPG